MEENKNYLSLMNKNFRRVFVNAFRVSLLNPRLAFFILKILRKLKKSEGIRETWQQKGLYVPPCIIASITNRCNLKCRGCYARAHKRLGEPEVDINRWRELLSEASDLGVSLVLVAGGEPLVRKDFLELCGNFPEMVFAIFTNGMLLDEETIEKLKGLKNVAPIISIEGFRGETDSRRGKGVYEFVRDAMGKLNKQKIFFGTSLTLTSKNFDIITGHGFINNMLSEGCRLFIFVEYVPVEESTEDLVLTPEQKEKLTERMSELKAKHKGLFIAFPGDEEKYGGCLAAGRGFVHISPGGQLEPCPFAPYSDTSLRDMSLKDALQSKFMGEIRENHHRLEETKGGCALWANKEWVENMAQKHTNI